MVMIYMKVSGLFWGGGGTAVGIHAVAHLNAFVFRSCIVYLPVCLISGLVVHK